MIVDVRIGLDLAWDPELMPGGWGMPGIKEPFDDWWARVGTKLGNLHPRIAEQWVYRHWKLALHRHLPLDRIAWRLDQWQTDLIISRAVVSPECVLDADFDYQTLHDLGAEPATTMNATGTWNIPIIMIEAPAGVLTHDGVLEATHHWLVEGHLRLRYLNALNSKGLCAPVHEVFVLSLK